MLSFVRTASHWVGRHAFPAIAASVIVVGAAGGGIGYAVASQHSPAAPLSPRSGSTSHTPGSNAKPQGTTGAAHGAQVIQRALSLLATQTGQSVASVRSQLDAGKSVDDIAGAKAPALESEILAQINKLAARAVSAGKLTSAQEVTGLAMAKTKVEALMAEPGTQLIKDAQKFLQFLQHGSAKHHAAGAAPTPSPAA